MSLTDVLVILSYPPLPQSIPDNHHEEFSWKYRNTVKVGLLTIHKWRKHQKCFFTVMLIYRIFTLIAISHGNIHLNHHDGFDTFSSHKVGSFLSSPSLQGQGHYDYDRIHFEEDYSHHGYAFTEPIFYDVRLVGRSHLIWLDIGDFRYDLPADIIRNKRDSRYFPGHVPAGVKGITKVWKGSFITQLKL